MPDTPITERDRKLQQLIGVVVTNIPAGLPEDQLDYLLENKGKIGPAVSGSIISLLPTPISTGEGWIDQLVAREAQRLRDFFGQSFDMTLMVNTLSSYGREKVEQWQSLSLAVGYLPAMVLEQRTKIRGWRKPEAWFWQKLGEGKLYRRNAAGQLVQLTEVGLEGIVVLYDTRQKPGYNNAKQMYVDDGTFMEPIISKLREEGKLQRHQDVPLGSRFYISSNEWDQHLRDAVAEFLGLEAQQVRLETAVEGNLIPQIFKDTPRSKDGKTDTWEWRDEYFEYESGRLYGGYSGGGGLADVGCHDRGSHWRRRAVRPLGVLATG